MAKTTNLKLLRKGSDFFWGHVNYIHDVGPFHFVEYVALSDDDYSVHFHIYIVDRDTGKSCTSLPEAMILAIALRNHPDNAQDKAEAACKLLMKG